MDKDEMKRLNFLLEIYVDVNVDKDFSVLSKNTDPFFIMNTSGQLVYVNEVCEELLQCSRVDLLGMKLTDIFISSVLSSTQTFFIGKQREQLTNFDSKISIRHRNSMDVNVTTFPILFNDEVVGSYVVLKDITLIKRERQLLSEKQAAAGQLAAGIAHEIRNPITAIKGFVQLMMSEHKGETTYYNIVESEINRVEMILKELMVLAKPTKIHYQELDIQRLLDKVLTLMESQTLLNNVEVIKNFHTLEVSVVGDENQLKQVFINYIKNAIEAMPDGGKLVVEGIHVNECVHIRIIDEGSGIPPDILERISEPFFTTKEHGTGLGMLVSNEIIEEHKGKINILSNTEGTSIEVILPTA
ncbi:PAS domain S-box-containing protein [Neobacillus niacini]|uniref:ATP-binding protein n=1 Tax=Neobacillus niacini TaxID=86668 RepID=UPI00278AE00C|nr:ATP-binding protein [Neobacillus niacini]MDQ1004417.1 PAS domain S-box-containing protein [Neobacillus niacini]